MVSYTQPKYRAKKLRVREAKLATLSGNCIFRDMSEEDFRKALDVLDKKYS